MYHETAPFIALICNKERVHKRGSVTMANNNRLIYSSDRGLTALIILKWILGYVRWTS